MTGELKVDKIVMADGSVPTDAACANSKYA